TKRWPNCTIGGQISSHLSVLAEHLGLKRHPAGSAAKLGTSPLIVGNSRSVLALGRDWSRASVYQCAGVDRICLEGPISMSRPAYITAMRSHMSAARLRS